METNKIPFDQWNPEATASYVIKDVFRDVYTTPNGVDLYDHWVSPRNIFKPAYGFCVCGLTLPNTPAILEIVKRYGGRPELDTNWYTDEGYGLAVFPDLESAFNFAMNEKDRLGKLFSEKPVFSN